MSLLVALTFTLTGCGDNAGKSLSDYPGASMGDSLMFYYARLRAYEYWKEARTDTMMAGKEQREIYLDGIRHGMDAVKKGAKDEIYNLGVRRGASIAMRMLELEREYGLDFNEDILLESFSYGVRDSTVVHPLEYQKEYSRLLGELKKRKRDENREASRLSLIQVAESQKMTRLQDNLYYKIVRKGHGADAQVGDAVFMDIDYQRANGADLAMPTPERITIGAAEVPEVMNLAYCQLNKGASGVFATTADAVFGSRAEIIGLMQDDVVIIHITMLDISGEGSREKANPSNP